MDRIGSDRITHSLTLSADEDRGVWIAGRTALEEEARGDDLGVSASSSSGVPVENDVPFGGRGMVWFTVFANCFYKRMLRVVQ